LYSNDFKIYFLNAIYFFKINLFTYIWTILENQIKQKVNKCFKKESDVPIVAKNEFKDINSTKNGNNNCIANYDS